MDSSAAAERHRVEGILIYGATVDPTLDAPP
jgi:hypothetical protein